MTNGSDDLGNGSASADDRFAGQLGYRGSVRRDPAGLNDPTDDLTPRNGSSMNPSGRAVGSVLDSPVPGMSLGELDSLAEPAYPPAGWLDSPSASLADHPLLRGLLLELPPKGAMPPGDWLDRWFEAARSILELLYVQHGSPGTNHR